MTRRAISGGPCCQGKEVPHGVRLYSIASTRYGDDFDGGATEFLSVQVFSKQAV